MASQIDREDRDMELLCELQEALDELLHASDQQREQKKSAYLQGLRKFNALVLHEPSSDLHAD
jgi:hypothetical protein